VEAANLLNASKERKTPQAILSLKNTVSIISQADIDRENLEAYLLQKQKNLLEELKKANKYTQVIISPKIIEMIEIALGISSDSAERDKESNGSTKNGTLAEKIDIHENILNKIDVKIPLQRNIRTEGESNILSENRRIVDLMMLYGWERVDCEEALLYAKRIEELGMYVCTYVFVHTYVYMKRYITVLSFS
jgi:hypothetical protein